MAGRLRSLIGKLRQLQRISRLDYPGMAPAQAMPVVASLGVGKGFTHILKRDYYVLLAIAHSLIARPTTRKRKRPR